MVDKLFIVKSPRSLRCSSKIFPMLYPILIWPLFHQGFHTKDGLDFLLTHGHGPVRPVRPRLLFLSSSTSIASKELCLLSFVLGEETERERVRAKRNEEREKKKFNSRIF